MTKQKECRVLQVMNALSMGGGETWLMALLRYFHEAGEDLAVKVRFDILLTEGSKQLFDDEAQSLGARLHYVRYSKQRLVAFARDMRRILVSGKYHAIHDHQGYPAGIHFLCGWGHLPPVRIAHIHNPIYDIENFSEWSTSAVIAIERRLLSRLATHIIATSKQMITEYGFDNGSFSHIERGAAHCGFDVSRFSGDYPAIHAELCREFSWGPSSKLMLFAGRIGWDAREVGELLASRKNPLFALEIAREAMSRDPDLRLLVAGGGQARKQKLEELVRTWGLDEKIKFLGVRHDIPRLMVGSDLLLFPSIAEGLGMVVVEAQAAGLRVLASDTTPREGVVLPEMVKFQSLSDNAALWADEALRMVNLPRPNAFECNRAVRASAFSIENSAARLISLYTSGN